MYLRITMLLAATIFVGLTISGCDQGDDDPEPEIEAPQPPANPIPADASVDVELTTALSWWSSGQSAGDWRFDVYFGSDTSPPLVSEAQSDTFYVPVLEFATTYNWKITVRNVNDDTAEGPIWTFQTASNFPPSIPVPTPPDGSEEFDIQSALSWSCTDPEDDPLVYDVFFGEDASPPLIVEAQSEESYQPEFELHGGTTYFWQIVARDNQSNETASPVWFFTTEREHQFVLGESGRTVSMVWIEPGSFMMGALNGEQGAQGDERPRHQVTITRGYWLGKFEVTQGDWEYVMGEWSFHFDGHENRPAEQVSWNDIEDFHSQLNSGEENDSWRLPTEAEWEYACRAGFDNTRFWWGNDPDYDQIDAYAWHWDNNDTGNGHETHDVGQKLPNPWGLYDMNGNVWEWCEDTYHNSYNGAPNDGSAWTGTASSGRIARGGGWGEYGAQFCRSAARGRDAQWGRFPIFGFRLCRSTE